MEKRSFVALTLFLVMAFGIGFVLSPQAEAITWWTDDGDEKGLAVDVTTDPPSFHIDAASDGGSSAIFLYLSTTNAKPTDGTAPEDDPNIVATYSPDNCAPGAGCNGEFSMATTDQGGVLEPGTNYYFGIYDSADGKYYYSYGPNEGQIPSVSFTTDEGTVEDAEAVSIISGGVTILVAAATTQAVAAIDGETITATVNGSISGTNEATGEAVAYADLRITARGVCWGETANPTADNGGTCINEDPLGTAAEFTITIEGLTTEETYHVNAYAVKGGETTYANDNVSFSTAVPDISTMVADVTESLVSPSIAITGAPAGVTETGICYSTDNDPTDDTGDTCVAADAEGNVDLSGLDPGTTYYVSAYAENDFGRSYTAPTTFKTYHAGNLIGDAGTPNLADAIACIRVSANLPVTGTINLGAEPSGNGAIDTADGALILVGIAAK